LIYGEKQLNTANLRSKQGNQLRGVKIKILSKKEKQKIRILDWFNQNLQENEFSRLNQGLDNLGQFWKEPKEKGTKVFCVKTTQEKKKTGSSQLLKNLRILSDKGLSKSL